MLKLDRKGNSGRLIRGNSSKVLAQDYGVHNSDKLVIEEIFDSDDNKSDDNNATGKDFYNNDTTGSQNYSIEGTGSISNINPLIRT